jgi:ABC-type phosphate transport system substrate-binding protein
LHLTHLFLLIFTSHLVVVEKPTVEAQSSVKLVGAGGAAAANLYNSYGVYYGYYKDNVALAYSAAPISQALTQYNQTLVDFVGVDTALDPDQLEGVSGLVQLPTAGLPLVLGYNLSSLLANDSLVRTTQTTFFPVTQRNVPQPTAGLEATPA